MLVTSRTPLRVSFFGGGTDYPEYYKKYKGAVLGTAINKHIYISALKLEKFLGYSYRLSYAVNEEVQSVDEIQHPVFRTVLKMLEIEPGWNFGILSSLPARSGLGSSSSFTVGLLNLLASIKDIDYTRYDLGKIAVHVEHDLLQENVGVQDQFHAAYGSLNRYEFDANDFQIYPVRLHAEVRSVLNKSMYLVHTGVARYASQVVEEQVKKTSESKIDKELTHLYSLVSQGQALLEKDNPEEVLKELGAMVDEGWQTKRSLSSSVSSPEIDQLYERARNAGALGGKLCGAGGGGFFFMVVEEDRVKAVQEALGKHYLIPIGMDETGSTILQS